MSGQALLRVAEHAVNVYGVLEGRGVHLSTAALHRVAAVHAWARARSLPWLLRGTAFRRTARLADLSRPPVQSLEWLEQVEAPWHVTFPNGARRAFVDRTFDFVDGSIELAGAWVAVLRGALVHTRSGLVCTSDGELIVDSVKKVERHLAAASTVDPARVPHLPGAWSTVMCLPFDNYYHWFNDCILRLYLLNRSASPGPLGVIVPPGLKRYQEDSLQACLPDGVHIEAVSAPWVRVERLVLPSFITRPLVGLVPPAAAEWVRARIVQAICGGPPRRGDRRLYLSRAGTNHRRVANEEAMTALLAARGFEAVRPETLTFDDQVRMFRDAGVIVGARGAGLTNMLFASSARVLELTAARPFAGPVYLGLAHSLGHEYHYLFTRPHEDGFTVDPGEFARALDAITS